MGEISKGIADELKSFASGFGDVIFGDGYIRDHHSSKSSSDKNSSKDDDDYYDDDYQTLDDDD